MRTLTNHPRGDAVGRSLVSRVRLWEILLLQLIAACGFFLDAQLVGFPVSAAILPFAVTQWAAFRLRNHDVLSYVNPFTIGVVSTWITAAVYTTCSLFHAPWRPFPGPPTLSNVLGSVLGLFLCSVIYGLIIGFFAIIFAAAFTPVDESSQDD